MKKMNVVYLFLLLLMACSKNDGPNNIDEPIGEGPIITEVNSYLNRVELGWEPKGGKAEYEIRYAMNRNMENAVVLEKIKGTSMSVKDLDTDQAYFWQIRAEIDGAWTGWSVAKRINTASFETSVASYNILGAEHDPDIEPEYAWHIRKEAVRNIILQSNNDPDILGVQEARVQIDEVIGLLDDHYNYHVSGRSISPQAIFWKPEKFELVSFNDDIDIFGSATTGRDNQRYVTHVRLRERSSGKELLIYNLHIPTGSHVNLQQLRGIAANNISLHAKQQASQHNIPAIVLGDFNNYPETVIGGFPSASQVMRNNNFYDTFDVALERINANYSTSVNRTTSIARIGENGSMRIDYLFTYPADQVAVTQYATIINFEGSSSTQLARPVPSDHHPVRAVLHLSY